MNASSPVGATQIAAPKSKSAEIIALPTAAERAKAFYKAARDWHTQVRRARSVSQRAKIVASVLTDHFNRIHFDSCGELMAFPSISTIDKESGMSRHTVFTALKDLEGLGYIKIKKGRGGRGYAAGNRYIATFPPAVASEDSSKAREGTRESAPGVNTSGAPVCTGAVHPGGTKLMTYPLIEPTMLNPPDSDTIAPRSRRSVFALARRTWGERGASVIARAEREGAYDIKEICETTEEYAAAEYSARDLCYATAPRRR
jgi:Helix-turn-helix domain